MWDRGPEGAWALAKPGGWEEVQLPPVPFFSKCLQSKESEFFWFLRELVTPQNVYVSLKVLHLAQARRPAVRNPATHTFPGAVLGISVPHLPHHLAN